jgi:hypothetical protein
MPSIRELISLLGDVGGTIALVTTIAVPMTIYSVRRFRVWYVEQNIRGIKREITQAERLASSPSARSELMQRRIFVVFLMLGLWIMFQSVGFAANGHEAMIAVHWLFGGAVYVVAVDTLTRVRLVDKTPERLERLRAKLAKLEGSSTPRRVADSH